MNRKEQEKIRKLLALALDPRGNGAECEAAGVKGIQLARKAGLSLEDLSHYLGGVDPEKVKQHRESEPQSDMEKSFVYQAARSVFEDALSELLPKPPKRRKR